MARTECSWCRPTSHGMQIVLPSFGAYLPCGPQARGARGYLAWLSSWLSRTRRMRPSLSRGMARPRGMAARAAALAPACRSGSAQYWSPEGAARGPWHTWVGVSGARELSFSTRSAPEHRSCPE